MKILEHFQVKEREELHVPETYQKPLVQVVKLPYVLM